MVYLVKIKYERRFYSNQHFFFRLSFYVSHYHHDDCKTCVRFK